MKDFIRICELLHVLHITFASTVVSLGCNKIIGNIPFYTSSKEDPRGTQSKDNRKVVKTLYHADPIIKLEYYTLNQRQRAPSG